jgi:hypothetical protein
MENREAVVDTGPLIMMKIMWIREGFIVLCVGRE